MLVDKLKKVGRRLDSRIEKCWKGRNELPNFENCIFIEERLHMISEIYD